MSLASLVVELSANTARFSSDMGKAVHMAERAAQSIKYALGTIGVGVSADYFAGLIKGSIDVQEKLFQMNRATGASVAELEQMRQVAQLSGTDFDTVGTAMARLARTMSGSGVETVVATQALKFLGISAKDSTGNFRDVGVVMKELADKTSLYADGAGKTALVQDILGKGAAILIPYMHELADTTERASGVTAESVKAAHEFTIQLKEMKEAAEQTWIQLANYLVPTLTDLLKKFNDLKASGGWANAVLGFVDLKDGTESIGEMESKLRELEKTRDALGSNKWLAKFWNMDDLVIVNAQIAMLETRIKAMQGLQSRQIREIGLATEPPSDSAKPGLKYNRGDPTAAAAELKLFTSSLQALEQELGKFNEQTQFEKTYYQTTEGSLKKLSKAHKDELLVLAVEIDERRNLLQVGKAWIAILQAEEATQNNINSMVANYNQTNHEYLQNLKFETGLIGKTAIEQEKLNAMHAIDLDLRQKLNAAAGIAGISDEQLGELQASLTKAAKAQKEAVLESVTFRIEKERDWVTGAKQAINDYTDAVTNAAAQTKNFFTNAFKSMEDALVEFTMTGKLDFKSLADSIISNLVRINIQRNIMAPIEKAMEPSGALGGMFGKLFEGMFGGGGSTSSMAAAAGNSGAMEGMLVGRFASGTDYVPRTGLALVHEGEAIIPAVENRGGGPNFYIDARGADQAAFARLERIVQQIGGVVKAMPATIADRNRRGGSYHASLS